MNNEFLKNNHPCELDKQESHNFTIDETPKEIKLFNRDGANLKLISEDGRLWKFDVDEKHKYILEYCRVGYQKGDKEIDFIDPSGGPMLSCGQRLSKNYVIDFIIEVDGQLMIHTQELEA